MRLWVKLTAALLPLVVAAATAAWALSYRTMAEGLRAQIRERVHAMTVQGCGPLFIEALARRDRAKLEARLEVLTAAGAAYAQALAPDGSVLADTRGRTAARAADAALTQAMGGGDTIVLELGGEAALIEATRAARRDGAAVGALRLAVAESPALAAAEAGSLRLAAAISLVAAVFLVLLAAVLIRLLRPLEELRRAVESLGPGGAEKPIPARSRDEVGLLTEAFNRMSARLAETSVSRDFLESVLEAAPEPMIVVDTEGRVVFANGKVSEVFGYAPRELRGELVEVLVPESLRARHAGLRGEYARQPRARPMGAGLDLRARRKDGTEVPVEISLSPARTRQGMRVIATIRDVTEQRRTREALRQSVQALQRSNEALEQFAFIASHDLQEPLRKVSSYCQLLERRYAEKLDSDGKDFIRYAVDGAARMRALVQDLLAYSRVGRQETPWERVDLSAVCGRALDALQPAIAEAGARVSVGELPSVRGRATALAQAFQNLVGNAVKFRAARRLAVRIDAERRDKEWVVSVEDNGIGIEERHRERVFDVFERLHPHTRYPGTGIGLAIVKRVVEQHGGRVWVDETPGGGSTFRFTLPVLEDA